MRDDSWTAINKHGLANRFNESPGAARESRVSSANIEFPQIKKGTL